MSVISGAQAESIKKSLDNIGAKDAYIRDLQSGDGSQGFPEYGAGDEPERCCWKCK